VQEAELLNCFPRPPRPFQFELVREVLELHKNYNAVAAGAATGAGKSDCFAAIAIRNNQLGRKTLIYTNRRMLTSQTIENLASHGIKCGVRAATLSNQYDEDALVQVSSMQTEIARTLKTNRWEPFPADDVLVDEAHLLTQGKSLEVLRRHIHAGAKLIGFTATPIGISHLYPVLSYHGKPSECLKYGAHVRAMIRAPFEFDLSRVKKVKIEGYDLNSFKQQIWTQQVVGRIIDSWEELNPEQRPTIAFAPDIECSIGLCNDFLARGIKACHVDGKQVYVDGEFYSDVDGSIRKETIQRVRDGEIKAVINRFCFREGIDIPELWHLILAAPISSLRTYIQTIGRIIRWSKSTPDNVLITDHAGNYHRFYCGPNTDLDWHSMFHEEDETEVLKKIVERHRKDPSLDPIVCQFCHTVRMPHIPKCPLPPFGCGKEAGRVGKRIIDEKGNLKLIKQPNYQERKKSTLSEDQRRWNQVYYSCRHNKGPKGKTFNGAMAAFKFKFGYYPPRTLDLMPLHESDWGRKVSAVKKEELRGGMNSEQ